MLTLPGKRQIFADDHEAFRASVSRFVAAEVTPHLDRWRGDGTIPRDVFAEAGAAGFLGTAVPEEFGGGGAQDLGFIAVLIEETAATGAAGLAWAWAVHAGIATTVLGSESDCARWLPGLAEGDLVAAVGAADVTLDDGRLSGRIPNVSAARIAHLLLVDLGDAGAAVVEIDQDGVSVAVTPPGLGAPESGCADITLDRAAVAATVPMGMGREIDRWAAVVAAASARAAFRLGIEYVSARKVFGRTLAEFQNTRFRLAELSAAVATTTSFVDSCVAAGGTLTPADAAAARLAATRLLDDVTDQCLQLHGGYGYMREYPISAAFADARFLRLTAQRFSDPRADLASTLGL